MGLFSALGDIFGGGGGSATTTSTAETSTITDESIEDNRIVVGDESLGVGRMELSDTAQFSYIEQFSPEVATAFGQLVDMSKQATYASERVHRGTLDVIRDIVDRLFGTSERYIESTERLYVRGLESSEQVVGTLADVQTGTLTTTRLLPFVIVGGLVIAGIAIFGKK